MVFALLGRRENLCAPQRGGVLLLLEEGERLRSPQRGGGLLLLEEGGTAAPHISFSLAREKETCRARYKEKERWERLS